MTTEHGSPAGGLLTEDLPGVRVITKSSSIIFFMPLYVPSAEYAAGRDAAIGASISPSTPCWETCGFQARRLLPHVRRYIYDPELSLGDGTTAALLTTTRAAVDWLRGSAEAKARWQIDMPRHRPIEITPGRGYLFSFYSGFVMVGLEVAAHSTDASDWFDLLHYGRFVNDRSRQIRITAEPKGSIRQVLSKLSGPAAAEVDESGDSIGLTIRGIGPVLDLLLSTAGFPSCTGRSITAGTVDMPVDSSQTLAYSVLLLEGDNAVRHGTQLVSRARGAHHSRRPVASLGFGEDEGGIVPYQQNSWFMVSSEGGGLLAVHAAAASLTQFDLVELPLHARTDYLFAFAFCAFQRYTMIRLSDTAVIHADKVVRQYQPRIASSEISSEPSRQAGGDALRRRSTLQELIGLERQVLEFTSRGVFAQISQSQHHHRYYQAVQDSNQIAALHEEVRQEVEALRKFEEARQVARRDNRSKVIELVLGLVTGVVIPMQLVAALFPATVDKWPILRYSTPLEQALGAVILVIVLLVSTAVLFYRAGRKTD